jgi:hypothetical protein
VEEEEEEEEEGRARGEGRGARWEKARQRWHATDAISSKEALGRMERDTMMMMILIMID